jgi:Ni/Co efflux regulator RcnB
MKRFLTAATAITIGLSMSIPLALAQPAPPGQHVNDKHQVTHTTTVKHETTVQHSTSIAQNGHLAGTPDYNHPPGYGDQRPPLAHQTFNTGHSWHRGDRYSGSREVVTNWSNYHAQRPPAGYEYVRDGNNLVLIAIASGVVASVLANALYQ